MDFDMTSEVMESSKPLKPLAVMMEISSMVTDATLTEVLNKTMSDSLMMMASVTEETLEVMDSSLLPKYEMMATMTLMMGEVLTELSNLASSETSPNNPHTDTHHVVTESSTLENNETMATCLMMMVEATLEWKKLDTLETTQSCPASETLTEGTESETQAKIVMMETQWTSMAELNTEQSKTSMCEQRQVCVNTPAISH